MNNTYLERLSQFEASIKNSEDPNAIKLKLSEMLLKSKAELSKTEFEKMLKSSEKALSTNCGCAEDLEFLEKLFEQLNKHKIFDTAAQNRIVKNSACGRWL